MASVEDIVGRSKKQLILGGIALVLVLGLLWVLLYSARTLKESWASQNEARAQETLRTINQALETFHGKYNGYPDSLERLRGGEEGKPATAPPERARLLNTDIAKNRFESSGYRFRYRRGARVDRWAATMQLISSYQVTAEPIEPGASGNLFFLADPSGEIHVHEGEAASPDDPVVGAAPQSAE
jgi:hypothetical protein